MRLSEAKSEKAKPLKIEFDGGGILEVAYRVPEYTPKQAAELMSGESRRNPLVMAESACRLLASWDLTDDDDRPIRLDPDEVAEKVGMNILAHIMQAVQKDQQPGEAGASSDAG